MKRIQRQRTKGWRMPEGAVYVGRPSVFGNPWTLADARDCGVPEPERASFCVAMYRRELDHSGLMSDWSAHISEARLDATRELMDSLPLELGPGGIPSVRPLFRHLLRDATALVCWCPLVDAEGRPVPCHADVLIELLADGR